MTVGELKKSISPFEVADLTGWEDLPVHQLIVVPGAVVDAERVCIAFTCPGMIARARGAANLSIKLAVDGKQKILANESTIVTLSFLVPSEAATHTKVTPQSRNTRVKVHTCTLEPFLQALVSLESEKNMTQTFEAACKVAADQCGLDLRHQVLQVHKDYAKGIEASRMKIFPHARRCDDYLHMRRAAYSTLQKLFGVGQEKSGPQNQKA